MGGGRCNRDAIGTILGAATGGLLGSQLGDGTGQMAAVGAGVFLGAILGGSIGRQMDQVDHSCVGQVLEYAPDNQAVTWQNPNTDAHYTTIATKTYEQPNGRYCREYQTTATVGGRVRDMYGTACRQPDGAWEIVN
ncbi:MAG: glycine zipper 2TM domain-containing protein [Rhodospirillales bacterium]|nr:glycine zipper 2TM domain-containing protein [Rhodospirillales bacterium]